MYFITLFFWTWQSLFHQGINTRCFCNEYLISSILSFFTLSSPYQQKPQSLFWSAESVREGLHRHKKIMAVFATAKLSAWAVKSARPQKDRSVQSPGKTEEVQLLNAILLPLSAEDNLCQGIVKRWGCFKIGALQWQTGPFCSKRQPTSRCADSCIFTESLSPSCSDFVESGSNSEFKFAFFCLLATQSSSYSLLHQQKCVYLKPSYLRKILSGQK